MQNLLVEILSQVADGRLDLSQAQARIQALSEADMGYAVLDTTREARCGTPEVVFAAGKTPAQVVGIASGILTHAGCVLLTRCNQEHIQALQIAAGERPIIVGSRCQSVLLGNPPAVDASWGTVAIVTAGTSDEAVAEEAALTCLAMGVRSERINDVGVAGLHRLMHRLPQIRAAQVVICIAGMEGALPSVVGGLVDRPVIAVPTSVGYGAAFSGLAALLGMLTSCASGITVVNIDNGFGAALAAVRVIKSAHAQTGTSHPGKPRA
jgi:NCAIR mutase (PurE)-related protein